MQVRDTPVSVIEEHGHGFSNVLQLRSADEGSTILYTVRIQISLRHFRLPDPVSSH